EQQQAMAVGATARAVGGQPPEAQQALPALDETLVNMTAVGLVDFLAGEQTIDQGTGGVADETRQEDQPQPRSLGIGSALGDGQKTEHESQESAAGVTHEQPGGWKVEQQKSQAGRGNEQGEQRQAS